MWSAASAAMWQPCASKESNGSRPRRPEELKALIETTLLEAAPELTTLVIERGQSLTTTPSTPLLQIMRRSDLNAPAVPDR